MVRIRLTRTGRKHVPRWRFGVFDEKTQRDGKALEYLGHYNPTTEDEEERVNVDVESARKWIDNGAQPTTKVRSLLREAGMEL
ncbi:MAG: 30S ribosomal protein S16 [Planctomycetota bacterium]